MSAWAIGTWAAVGVLAGGSVAVFAWFLRDALRLLRARRQAARDRSRRN